MTQSIAKPTALATLVCGTLDVIYPTTLAFLRGDDPAAVWQGVASGPFPGASEWGTAGILTGLVVHYAIMAVMAAVFMAFARSRPALLARPVLAGIAYGAVTYVVMNLVVLPLRFGRRCRRQRYRSLSSSAPTSCSSACQWPLSPAATWAPKLVYKASCEWVALAL